MKKLVSLFLVLTMLLSLAGTVAAEVKYPLSEEPVTLTVAIPKQAVHESEKDLQIWKDLEALTNVKCEFVEVPEENINEVVGIMLATGDYPDVFWGGLLTNEQIATYGQMGVLQPLDDLIAQYAPTINEMMTIEEYARALTTVNDTLYAVPRVDHNPGNYATQKMWIMEEWLWKLDMDFPTTLDEFRNVLQAIKDNDVNGNGDPNDEIPMLIMPHLGLGSLYGPFGVVDNQSNHMMVKDGKLMFVPIQEGYRDGLEYYAGLYADGLIWNETFTTDHAQASAIAQDSPIRFGVIVSDGLTGLAGQKYFFYYDILRPIAGANGERLWANGTSPSITPGFFAITDKCKNPEIAIQWADYFYTQQGTLEFYRGIENETWKWNEDGTYVHLSVPANLGIDQNTWVASQRYGGIAPGWFSQALRSRNIADMSLLNGQTGQKQWRQTSMYVQYQPEEYVPSLVFTAEESDELSYIQPSLFNYVAEMEAKFVSGQASLADWDAYVAQVKAMGLDRLMKIYQTAFDRMTAN